MKKKIIICFFIFSIILFSRKEENIIYESKVSYNEEVQTVFNTSQIPKEIISKMQGNSMPQNAKINYNDLTYVTVNYYNFKDEIKKGELIVNKKLGQEVLEIFKELYDKHYQIEKIRLIDEYGANDVKSMEDNNTSAFCYRMIEGTNHLSNHAKGCAIDINPLQNPQVINGAAYPKISQEYVDRTKLKKGMIKSNDICYMAFIKRGWTWGGTWKNPDYQHFEKQI